MTLPATAAAADVCHRCDAEPATAAGILCGPCRHAVAAAERRIESRRRRQDQPERRRRRIEERRR